MNKKNKGLSLVIMVIVLVVYNIIAFILPFNRGGIFWTGYLFSMLAILLTMGIGFYALGREGLKSKVYGCPLLSLVWCYLIVQLIVGLLEMNFSNIPLQYGIVLNAVLFGACTIGLIATDIAKEEIERIDSKVKERVNYMKSLQTDIENLINRSPDEVTQQMLINIAEAIRYSDPMSSPQLTAIENKIESNVADLTDAINTSDSSKIKSGCDELKLLIAERNSKCKAMK